MIPFKLHLKVAFVMKFIYLLLYNCPCIKIFSAFNINPKIESFYLIILNIKKKMILHYITYFTYNLLIHQNKNDNDY